ncbi:MAG: heavy-metal-associated domain-containing protein, partial [Candidatus Hydrogenedentota bacterium]
MDARYPGTDRPRGQTPSTQQWSKGMSGHNPTTEIQINVSGMDCPSCAEKIEKVVSGMKGVESVAVSFSGGRLTVRF